MKVASLPEEEYSRIPGSLFGAVKITRPGKWVSFKSPHEADMAMNSMHRKIINDTPLVVKRHFRGLRASQHG